MPKDHKLKIFAKEHLVAQDQSSYEVTLNIEKVQKYIKSKVQKDGEGILEPKPHHSHREHPKK
eukprot:GAHX01002567.1.p1 GENE.GAHX01002567.1~~GAHX01002567.1.p1  ORF type:complete len:63 (+),score=7.54 GAHX01002567.1:51-239(+)